MKRALITGITGQDGSYLAEQLLADGHEVWGVMRRASTFNTGRIDHLYTDPHDGGRLRLVHGDMTDAGSLQAAVEESMPDEVYNLAAQSHVAVSFQQPVYTMDAVALGTVRLLEAVARAAPEARFYQASSSEMFGSSPPPQHERTPFHPRSPYGASKVAAHHAAVNYREARGMFVCCGVLFNHESPRRGETFVTRKVTRAVGRIKHGLQDRLYLGNMLAERDWGWAPDYVRAMRLMLEADEPGDYVVATGEAHHVGEFVEVAFAEAGLCWRDHVEEDDRYLRPSEVHSLRGQPGKAERELGWSTRVGFEELVRRMVRADVKLAEGEALLRSAEA